MKKSTLFLVQASYSCTPNAFSTLLKMAAADDLIILMGDAVMHAASPVIANFSCAILETEQALIPADFASNHFAVLNYAQFADLCLQHSRVVTLK
jgi:sulfur transfer complex TusBCD TusB component (DsrH family)